MNAKEFHITFDNGHTLIFDLIDHPIVDHWSRLLTGYQMNSVMVAEQTNDRYHATPMTEVVGLMNSLVGPLRSTFGDFFDEGFYATMGQTTINRDELNVLHDGYERVQAMMVARPTPRLAHERLVAQQLNEYVHKLEMFIHGDGFKSELGPRPRTKVRMVNYEDNTSAIIKLPFYKDDYKIFEPKNDGRLYLTYCQVGKSPLSVYKDDDDHAEDPVPWEVFGPSFWFSMFGYKETADFSEARKWLTEHTGRGDWVLGDPCIGKLRGNPLEAWVNVYPDPKITGMSFIHG